MKHFFKTAITLFKETGEEWWAHKAPSRGAAISYYTVFSLAPVLILVVAVAGFFLGKDATEGHIVEQMQGLIGAEGAKLLQDMLAKSSAGHSGLIATIVGFVILLIGATSVMVELQDALNTVWKVVLKPTKGGSVIWSVVRDRLLSLGLILSFGFVLLVSLAMSAALSALGTWFGGFMPAWVIVGHILSEAVSLGVIALFIALIFKILPSAKIGWRDVFVGALLTSVLFHLGKLAIGLYIGKASLASTFGATGSLAVLLVWVYYSSQIVLLGAVFTRVFAERVGKGVRPDENAEVAPELPDPDAPRDGAGPKRPPSQKQKPLVYTPANHS